MQSPGFSKVIQTVNAPTKQNKSRSLNTKEVNWLVFTTVELVLIQNLSEYRYCKESTLRIFSYKSVTASINNNGNRVPVPHHTIMIQLYDNTKIYWKKLLFIMGLCRSLNGNAHCAQCAWMFNCVGPRFKSEVWQNNVSELFVSRFRYNFLTYKSI